MFPTAFYRIKVIVLKFQQSKITICWCVFFFNWMVWSAQKVHLQKKQNKKSSCHARFNEHVGFGLLSNVIGRILFWFYSKQNFCLSLQLLCTLFILMPCVSSKGLEGFYNHFVIFTQMWNSNIERVAILCHIGQFWSLVLSFASFFFLDNRDQQKSFLNGPDILRAMY